MIRSTFSILSGIGERLEKRIWKEGVLTWEDFLEGGGVSFLSSGRKAVFDEQLQTASGRLDALDSVFFKSALNGGEHWRLYDVFGEDAAYLDIETNGLPPGDGGYTTVLGIYGKGRYKAFVHGEGLEADGVMEELSGYKYLVSFFGSVFDVPFLERTLHGFRLDVPHFDLCMGGRKIGLRGGLKKIEESVGIKRPDETRGMNGYDAVLLWNRARRGDTAALDLLIRYNMEDTANLAVLAGIVYDGLRASTGIEEYLNGDS